MFWKACALLFFVTECDKNIFLIESYVYNDKGQVHHYSSYVHGNSLWEMNG